MTSTRATTNTTQSATVSPLRAGILLLLLMTCFAALFGRSFYLQVIKQADLEARGEARFARTLHQASVRGRIIDRNNQVLAASIPARAIWAIPQELLQQPRVQRQQLAKALALSELEFAKIINKKERFVYLRRQVSPDIAQKIADLKIKGVYERDEFVRHYAEGLALAPLLGRTSIDGKGVEGIERWYNAVLSGEDRERRVIKDRKGKVVENISQLQAGRDGSDLQLTIDARVQYDLFDQLRAATLRHEADSAAGIVIDAQNGEVLAMSQYPSFDPNGQPDGVTPALGNSKVQVLRNKPIIDTFEPGSTMKPIAAAAAIEHGFAKPQTNFQTQPGRITIDGKTVSDTHNYGTLSLSQVIEKSSNVGMSRLVLPMPNELLYDTYRAAGIGMTSSLRHIGGVAAPLRRPETWRKIEKATMSYGHGLALSLAQLAEAYTIFTTDGERVPLRIVNNGEIERITVLKPSTARAMRTMLELATSKDGTGFSARIPGYRVAGKTGTARKLENGRYVQQYLSSFIGFSPVSKPRFIVAVMVDNPRKNGYYGGGVAAPVFARVMQTALNTHNVPPDSPRNLPPQTNEQVALGSQPSRELR